MATKNYVIGALILTILLGSIYITIPNQIKIQVFPTYTKYFVWEPTLLKPNGTWVNSASEYVYLYNGTKKLLATSRIVSNYTNETTTILYRVVNFADGISIIHNYTFDGSVTDINKIPIKEQIECLNCASYTLQIEVKNLMYNGGTREAHSPELFGHNMKVEWQDGSVFSKITQLINGGKLVLKYKPSSNYEIYDVKVSDPTFPPAGRIRSYYNFTVADTYPMNNGTDAMGNNHGSFSNGAYTCSGYFGMGLCLDGVNDWFNISNTNFFVDDNQNNFTIGYWVKPTVVNTNANDRMFFVKNSSMTSVLDFFTGSINNGTTFTVQGGTVRFPNTSTDKINQGEWTYVTVRLNGTRVYLYRNGIKVNDSLDSGISATAHPFPAITNISLGRPDANGLNGVIDEFIYMIEPLNDSAIYGLYLNYTAGYSPFNDTSIVTPPVYIPNTLYRTYFNFSDLSGVDAFGSNNGTFSNGATTTTGYLGNGLLCDGVNDWFNISNNNFMIDENQNNFTVCMWIKPTVLTTNANDRFFFVKNSSMISVIDFYIGNSKNTTAFTIFGGTTQLTNWSSDAVHQNQWSYLCTRWNNSRTYLYKNGIKVNDSLDSGIASDTHPLPAVTNISICRPDANGFNGVVDEFLYAVKPLNDTAIYGLYSNYTAGYSPFDDITVPPVPPTLFDPSWSVLTATAGTLVTGNINVTHPIQMVDTVIIEVQYPNGTRRNYTAVKRYV